VTPFQSRVLAEIVRAGGGASAWAVAARLPGWSKRAAHGALVANVTRAGQALASLGCVVLTPARDQHKTAFFNVTGSRPGIAHPG
jgi:hypothetical protein